MKLRNVLFPRPEGSTEPLLARLWDVSLVDGVVESMEPAREASTETEADADGDSDDDGVASQLLLPPLCHPHLHLDKAYLLTSSCCGVGCSPRTDTATDGDYPDYTDLLPQTGSFAEALQTTAVAKSRFTAADLHRRGLQLLATSYAQGVTSARVFVEVDAQAAGRGTVAVAVARELQALFRGDGGTTTTGGLGGAGLKLQVCAFAQEVLFTGAAGTANRMAMEAVLEVNRREEEEGDSNNENHDATVAVLGTTPYVEATRAQALQNIDWAVSTALKYGLHLDLHLDYNLNEYGGTGTSPDADAASEPLIFALLEALVRHNWRERATSSRITAPGSSRGRRGNRRTVVVGHATQLTRLPPAQLTRLATAIREHELPVYLVGLPTSDIYMMGRQQPPAVDVSSSFSHFPRGTLPIPALIRQFGLRACLGVNNVGNAFTPYGTGDPLQLACWGVGLYHAGTGPDAHLLYGSVSWRAREAIGMDDNDDNDDVGEEEKGGKEGGAKRVDWEKNANRRESDLLGKRIGPVLAIANRRYIKLPLPLHSETARSPQTVLLSRIPARPRLGFRDVVWDPPDVSLRRVV